MNPHNEIVFESDIVRALTSSPVSDFSKPYLEGENTNFDPELCLYTEDLVSYIKATQPIEWEKYNARNPQNPEAQLAKDIAKYMDANGALHSLRRGVEFVGGKFFLVGFKPDNISNPKTRMNYDANILRVVRQVKYSPYHKEMIERGEKGSGIIDVTTNSI